MHFSNKKKLCEHINADPKEKVIIQSKGKTLSKKKRNEKYKKAHTFHQFQQSQKVANERKKKTE
jgi:hypothetical protein